MKAWFVKYHKLLFNLFVLGGITYLIISRLDQLEESFAAIQSSDPLWLIFGISVYFMGMPLMAVQLKAIALKPLRFFTTYKVQMAALFVNRVVPSNLGLVLLNTYYLKKYSHSNTETASVIGVSAFTSAFAFIFIIIISFIIGRGSEVTQNITITIPGWILPIFVGVITLCALSLWRSPFIRQNLKKPFLDITWQLKGYRNRPKDILIALFGNGLATMTSVVALFACAHSLDVSASLSLALITYVLGNALGGLVPTPGGLGGVEAGLYTGLILGGISSGDALSIVLLYRLITYWLALVPGILFFIWLRKDVLSTFTFNNKA